MAARRPFWKWHRQKSIGFCLWPPSTCTENLKLKFQSKLDLCSGNHAAYRVKKPKNPIWPLGGHFENDVAENEETQCATFPIDWGPDLGKNWVGLGKLSNLVTRRSMVISCVLLYDSITGLWVYTVGLWWIILTLDRWSMTSENTISHTGDS